MMLHVRHCSPYPFHGITCSSQNVCLCALAVSMGFHHLLHLLLQKAYACMQHSYKCCMPQCIESALLHAILQADGLPHTSLVHAQNKSSPPLAAMHAAKEADTRRYIHSRPNGIIALIFAPSYLKYMKARQPNVLMRS